MIASSFGNAVTRAGDVTASGGGFTEAPEPGPALTLGLGLAALGLGRSRRAVRA